MLHESAMLGNFAKGLDEELSLFKTLRLTRTSKIISTYRKIVHPEFFKQQI